MIRIGVDALPIESDATAGLRSALALSCASGVGFRWEGFRHKISSRSDPAGPASPAGLGPVDAANVKLFAAIGNANVDGGQAGDDNVSFEPSSLRAGDYSFDIAAGEPLGPIWRAVLVPLARAEGSSSLSLAGSTHAPGGETFEVMASSFEHYLRGVGIEASFTLECAGFAPRGGGEVRSRIESGRWRALLLVEREELASIRIVSAGASLPAHVQQRQAARARYGVHVSGLEPAVQLLKLRSRSAGSVVAVTGYFGDAPVTFAAVSARGRSAESVGEEAASAFRRFAAQPHAVPGLFVDAFLAFMAFADGESIQTTPRLPETTPDLARLIRAFTGRDVRIDGKRGQPARVRVMRGGLQT